MQENTNKAIAINSIVLYTRLAIISICSLVTTRFALQALGVTDFGLFSVLGSVISFMAIFNTIMVSTSNRFITVALGKNDISGANKQFNVNLSIHITIAILTLLLALSIGNWYVENYLHFDGNISNAHSVFRITIVGSILSFIGVPYNGLLVAKEKFIVFCSVEVISHILRTIIAILLVNHFSNKLIIYAVSITILTVLPSIVNAIYCHIKYPELTRFKLVKDTYKYREVFSFAGWVSYGAFATVGKNQGAQILVNAFFNTSMNTALGLANTVNTLLITSSNSIAQPISPQITKNYASGNMQRCNSLLIMATKYTFLVTLIISVPFLTSPSWIFSIWLGEVPSYVVEFTLLIIIDTLITSLNAGISNIIFASGKIKNYQITINTLRLFSIVAAFIVLRLGVAVYFLLYAYIVFSILIFFSSQYVLRKTLNFDNSILWKQSYIPCFFVTILLFPSLFLSHIINPMLAIIIVELYLLFLIVLVALSNDEKKKIVSYISKYLHI